MIYVKMSCGLGNWLFQYAIGKHLALMHNTQLVLDLHHFIRKDDISARRITAELDKFNLSAQYYKPFFLKLAKTMRLKNSLPKLGQSNFEEIDWGFNEKALLLPDETYLAGFFQSYKYHYNIEENIRNDFQFTFTPMDNETIEIENQIKSVNGVSLHIRRGDYLRSKSHNVCGIEYYQNALKYAEKHIANPFYFIFSDDIDWCKVHFKIKNAIYVDIPASKQSAVNDFRLMSMCNHNILPNSTYSWWAAWLNSNPEKIVIAPDRWFNNNNNSRAMRDMLPEKWVKISHTQAYDA